jgi:hypothetical protein
MVDEYNNNSRNFANENKLDQDGHRLETSR